MYFVGGFGTNDASIPGDFQLQAICSRTQARSRTAGLSRGDLLRRHRQDNARDQASWQASR